MLDAADAWLMEGTTTGAAQIAFGNSQDCIKSSQQMGGIVWRVEYDGCVSAVGGGNLGVALPDELALLRGVRLRQCMGNLQPLSRKVIRPQVGGDVDCSDMSELSTGRHVGP